MSPYKFESDKLLIPRQLKLSVKLSLEEREEIRKKYANKEKNKTSLRKLAKEYNVSKRLIQFIINPEKEKANKELQKGKQTYDKDYHRKAVIRHRRYKKDLYKQGKLEGKIKK